MWLRCAGGTHVHTDSHGRTANHSLLLRVLPAGKAGANPVTRRGGANSSSRPMISVLKVSGRCAQSHLNVYGSSRLTIHERPHCAIQTRQSRRCKEFNHRGRRPVL